MEALNKNSESPNNSLAKLGIEYFTNDLQFSIVGKWLYTNIHNYMICVNK